MRRLYFFFAIALLACSHKTADQQLIDAADPAASWMATLQLTGRDDREDGCADVDADHVHEPRERECGKRERK